MRSKLSEEQIREIRRREEANEKIPEEIKQKVAAQVEREFANVKRYRGLIHQVWAYKRELYKQYGYEWYSVMDLNPDMYVD